MLQAGDKVRCLAKFTGNFEPQLGKIYTVKFVVGTGQIISIALEEICLSSGKYPIFSVFNFEKVDSENIETIKQPKLSPADCLLARILIRRLCFELIHSPLWRTKNSLIKLIEEYCKL